MIGQGHGHLAPGPGELKGVQREVVDRPVEQVGIARNVNRAVHPTTRHPCALRCVRVLPGEMDGVPGQRRHIHPLRLSLPQGRELQELREETA